MLNRKKLIWFLLVTFAISWPLFLLPLAFRDATIEVQQIVALVAWSLAMFGPGVAALLTTRFVAREPLGTLNLGRLGPKRFYLWAWLLPGVLALLALVFTVALGLGTLDLRFQAIQAGLEALPEDVGIPLGLVLAGQILVGLTLGPLINTIPAMGEELGWRGFLLPELLSLGKWRAIVVSNVIWGVWHAPAIAQGHNYPGRPILGIFLMIGFCLLFGTILSWLYFETNSPWVAALGHGSLNATAGLPLLFLEPGIDIVWGGTLAAPAGWIGMGLFVAWLVLSRRLPRPKPQEPS